MDADLQVETGMTLAMMEKLHAGRVQLARVQNTKFGRQTAVLSEGATESRAMPVRHEMLDQHLCKGDASNSRRSFEEHIRESWVR